MWYFTWVLGLGFALRWLLSSAASLLALAA